MPHLSLGFSSAIGCRWTAIIGIRLESATLELMARTCSSSGFRKDRKKVSYGPSVLTRCTGGHRSRRKARINLGGHSKHHAQKVLTLLSVYLKKDVLAAMQRAVTYRAFGYSFLERILAHQSTPKAPWQQLSESEQEAIAKLTDSKPIPPRHSREYQDLLYGKKETSPETHQETPSENQSHEPQEDDK